MASPTNYYVDPLNGSDSTGNGTSGTPWKSVQKALNTITRDATNGDQINVRDTADDVLASSLNFGAYGTPAANAPLVVRGYTSAAGDGGVGALNGNGLVAIVNQNVFVPPPYLYFIDLRLHNAGASNQIAIGHTYGNSMYFFRCKIENAGGGGIQLRVGMAIGCHFKNLGGIALDTLAFGGGIFAWNFFESGPVYHATTMLDLYDTSSTTACFNIIKLGGASGQIGIFLGGDQNSIFNNVVWAPIKTDKAGLLFRTVGYNGNSIYNNIFEGLAIGINFVGTGHTQWLYGRNAFYDCASNYNSSVVKLVDVGADISLASSPFTDPANNDFSVSTALKAAGYPSSFLGSNTNQYLDIGAAQRQEAGGLALNPIGSHIIRGLI